MGKEGDNPKDDCPGIVAPIVTQLKKTRKRSILERKTHVSPPNQSAQEKYLIRSWIFKYLFFKSLRQLGIKIGIHKMGMEVNKWFD